MNYNFINQEYINYCVAMGFPPEQFKTIDFWSISPNTYIISSYGRLFSMNKNFNQEMTQLYDNGYRRVVLALYDGSKQSFKIHRLVAKAFIPKTEEDVRLGRDLVNHKDLCKFNNVVWNLEWVTNDENVTHAIMNNARNRPIPISFTEQQSNWGTGSAKGDNNGKSRLTEEQVHIICQCLEQRMSYSDCCIYAGLEDNDRNRNVICNIARGDRRQDISSQYNIPKDNINTVNDYSRFVRPVCELLQQGYRIVDIVKMLHIDDNNYDRARMFVSGIKNKKYYTQISQFYNF